MRLQSLLLLLLLFFAADGSVGVVLSDDEDTAEDVVLCRRCDRERDGKRRRGNVVGTVLEDGNTNEPVIVSVSAAGSATIRRGRYCWKCNPSPVPLGLVLLQQGNQNKTEDATQNRTMRRRGNIIAVQLLAAAIVVGASLMWCER